MYRPRFNGFTLIEVLIVTTILTLLIALLLPVFAQTREKARAVSCLSNTKQIGLALLLYADDYEGALVLYAHYPTHSPWFWQILMPYQRTEAILRCPSAPWAAMPNGLGYGVNFQHVIRYGPGWSWVTPSTVGPAYLGDFARPAETLVLADSQIERGPQAGIGFPALYDPQWGVPWQYADLGLVETLGFADRHTDGANVLFLDGHARRINRQTLLQKQDFWGRE